MGSAEVSPTCPAPFVPRKPICSRDQARSKGHSKNTCQWGGWGPCRAQSDSTPSPPRPHKPPSTLSWWEEMETEQLFDGEIACRQAPAEQNFINCFRLQTVHPQLPWPPSFSPFIPASESHYLSLSLSISPSLHSCPTVPPSFYLSIIRPSIPVPPSFHPLFFKSSILLSLSSVLQSSHPSFPPSFHRSVSLSWYPSHGFKELLIKASSN